MRKAMSWLCITAALACSASFALGQTTVSQELDEVNRVIADLRSQQAEVSRHIQMLEDGTAVMAPFAYQGEDGRLYGLGDPTHAFVTAPDLKGAVVKTDAVIAMTTRALLVNEIAKADFDELGKIKTRVTVGVATFVKALKKQSREVVLPAYRLEQESVNKALLGLMKRRDTLSARVRAGEGDSIIQSIGAPRTASGWAGTWISDWGDMEIQVSGSRVTGTFKHKGGKIEGDLTADGRKIMGRWTQTPTRMPPADAGAFEFALAPDGKHFSGRWWYGFDTSRSANGGWRATAKGK